MLNKIFIQKIENEIKLIDTHLDGHKLFIESCKEKLPDSTGIAAIGLILFSFYNGLERIISYIAKDVFNFSSKNKESNKELIRFIKTYNSEKEAKILSDESINTVTKYIEGSMMISNNYDFQLDWNMLKELFININNNWIIIKGDINNFLNSSDIGITEKNLFDDIDEGKKDLSDNNTKTSKVKSNNEYLWQVSYGSSINLMLANKVISSMLTDKKKIYRLDYIGKLLGFAEKKSQGFAKQLYFMGLLDEKKCPTKLAELVLEYDPYFEDTGTLWFIHFQISSAKRYYAWNKIINGLFERGKFKRDDFNDLIKDIQDMVSREGFDQIKKEFKVCIDCYIESEFQKLNLITYNEDEDIYIRNKTAIIPDEILLSCVLYYKEEYFEKDVVIEVKSLLNDYNTPCKLLFINEEQLRLSLERLRKEGFINIESFADLDQIKFIKNDNYFDILKRYYENKYTARG